VNRQGNDILAAALGVASPFPWQIELLRRFLKGEIPPALDIPTGLGKTAVMAVWLVARAMGARIPRRLVYVVDRRAVVDQATKVAEDLRKLVEKDVELKRGLGLARDLPISTLRGQFADNRAWLEDPSSPAIVIGTVDMVGSRILFEGYGVSRKMRPYHAGLLGMDTLLVLDEAHLVPPFERLIASISTDKSLAGKTPPLAPPLQLLSLSATGRAQSGALTLSVEDQAHPVVKERLMAEKQLQLKAGVERKNLPRRLAEEALGVVDGRPLRCIIFCDSRDDARKVYDELNNQGKSLLEVQLLVGARRVYERAEVAQWLAARGFLPGSNEALKSPAFLIATSAGEVGVDLDADHMVSDVVPWERMVQRLGRVNRRGHKKARVVVIPVLADGKTLALVEKHQAFLKANDVSSLDEDDEEDGDDDGDKKRLKPRERAIAERHLRAEAAQLALVELPHREKSHDASPGALTELRRRASRDPQLHALLARATTPEPLRPELTRALIESWSMTSLENHTGRPEVTPWLRGWIDDEEPQTTIVWRERLPIDAQGRLFDSGDLEHYFDAAPLHLLERLETESWRAAEWLQTRLERSTGKPIEKEPSTELPGSSPLLRESTAALILRRDGTTRPLRAKDFELKSRKEELPRLLSNAIVVVDVRLGGLSQGLLDEASHQASDIGSLESDGRPPLPFRMQIRDTMEAAQDWREEARFLHEAATDGEAKSWLVIESDPHGPAQSEEGRSATPTRDQLLDQHQEWTATSAKRIAERLGLASEHVELLMLAAQLHDEGKRAKRWQAAFRAPTGADYAKTRGRPNFKLLDGYRHELGSLPTAEQHPRVIELTQPLRDLCLHLIAAHHGYARPVIRTDGAEEPPSLLQSRAQEIALRFTRLEKQWGPWGLAWWESLLRAADQQASRRNDLGGPNE
jgi:CRISPR-associated endonuclease/helicase Cas3